MPKSMRTRTRCSKYVKLSEQGKRVSARTAKIPAWIELGNETDFPHEGTIDFVDNDLIPGRGRYVPGSFLKNWNPNFITPGFFVRVRVSAQRLIGLTLVPDRVISSQQGLKYVFVVKPDYTVERRNLETGGLFEGKRIVKSGLKDGEKVVSTRLQIIAKPECRCSQFPSRKLRRRSRRLQNPSRDN